MPLPDEPQSSPPNVSTSPRDAIAYYKAQYEQLEAELADFQASSRELESELEKDIEQSEKRERKLREKLETVGYEAEEWMTKYKQAKSEANAAQGTLQKEITTLRDANRTLQLKLRDIEVANDDFERQARNTTSSLEDMESKYNVAIERGVLLEGEIKAGEQEREALRIETQRLRDELSDLKVEAHIIQEKLRKAETVLKQQPNNTTIALNPASSMPHTPDTLEHSPATSPSSPTVATPPTKSVSSVASDVLTPPSPPFSESSTSAPKANSTPIIQKPRFSISESTGLPKMAIPLSRSTHSRGPSIPVENGRSAASVAPRRPSAVPAPGSGLPRSGSLYQIRGLIGKMQKLEQRVQSARSRLPAPVGTPPNPGSRSGSALGQNYIPSTVTVRSSRKRASASTVKSKDGESTPSYLPHSRDSFGYSQRTPSRSIRSDSRPSSRNSVSSRASMSHGVGSLTQQRPDSRQNATGARTPLGHYSKSSISESRRPRSSLSNYSQSIAISNIEEKDGDGEITTPTPRRSTFNKNDLRLSGIPTPSGPSRRLSGGLSMGPPTSIPTPRRISSGFDRRDGEMPPPERKKKLSDLGETY